MERVVRCLLTMLALIAPTVPCTTAAPPGTPESRVFDFTFPAENSVAATCFLWQDNSMKWEELLHIVKEEPVFSTAFLLAGPVNEGDVLRQLSRWTRLGRLVQFRRGLYGLSGPYRKTVPHPFLLSNRLKEASYVSLQSALSWHGLIPEAVPVVTAVSTGRPETLETPAGVYQYRHILPRLFHGYRREELGNGQASFVALPEKALLDLIHLTPGADGEACLHEMRLQNTGRLDRPLLHRLAEGWGGDKPRRAVRLLDRILDEEHYEAL